MNLFKINIKQTMVKLFMTAMTVVLILIYLSVHAGKFNWLWNVKNTIKDINLYPIIALAAGSLGSIVAGNSMQYITRNKLASPFTMGILPSASLSAVVLRLSGIVSLWLTLALGILFAITILSLVLFTSYKNEKSNMIVVGLAIGMVIMGINFLLAMNLPHGELVFRWFARGGQDFNIERIKITIPFILIFSFLLLLLNKSITYYRRSPIKALTVGINIKYLVWINYFCVAAISVSTVLIIGEIAFIGMAIPNITKLLIKSDKMLANVLLGTLISFPLLLGTIIIANMYIINFQLLTTVICAPIFIFALVTRRLYEK